MLPSPHAFLESFRHLHCRAPTPREAFEAGARAALELEASRSWHTLPLRPLDVNGTRAHANLAPCCLAEKRSVERGAGVGES